MKTPIRKSGNYDEDAEIRQSNGGELASRDEKSSPFFTKTCTDVHLLGAAVDGGEREIWLGRSLSRKIHALEGGASP